MLNFLITAEELTQCKELSPRPNQLAAIIEGLDLHHSSTRDDYTLGINITRSFKHVVVKDGITIPFTGDNITTPHDLLDYTDVCKEDIKAAERYIALVNDAWGDVTQEAYVLIGICKDNVFGKYVDLIAVDHSCKNSAGNYQVVVNNYLFDAYVREFGDSEEKDTVTRVIVDLLDLLGKNTSSNQQ